MKRSSTEPAEVQEAALDLAPSTTGEVHRECVCVCLCEVGGGEESLRSSTETTENTGILVFPALKQVLMSSLVSPVEMLR